MKRLTIGLLLASSVAVAGCAVTPAPVAVAATGKACGTYGYVDINNDGFITGDEWNTFRTSSYGAWDVNGDGRISQSEFEGCYRGGGFYRTSYYNPDYWNNYWTTFDANGDGYLSNDEYWSANAYTTIDKNRNGRIDSDEWVWWP